MNPSRQVRRAEQRQAVKEKQSQINIARRVAKRTEKGLQALSRGQRRGYPKARNEPFEPTGKDWRFVETKGWFGKVTRTPRMTGFGTSRVRRMEARHG